MKQSLVDEAVEILERVKRELEEAMTEVEKCFEPLEVAKYMVEAISESAKNMTELLVADAGRSAVKPATVAVYLLGVNGAARSIAMHLDKIDGSGDEPPDCEDCKEPSCPSSCGGDPDHPHGGEEPAGVCLKCNRWVRKDDVNEDTFPISHARCGGEVAVELETSIGTVVDKTKATDGPSETSNMPPSESKAEQ